MGDAGGLLSACCMAISASGTISTHGEPSSFESRFGSKGLAQPDAVDLLAALLNRTRLDPPTLILEITENMEIQQPDLTLATLGKLRRLGVQVGPDNFGTGYSSLSDLHRFPVNVLKIDRALIQTLSQDSENGEIVRTIVTLAEYGQRV